MIKWACDSKRGTVANPEPRETSKLERFGEVVNG